MCLFSEQSWQEVFMQIEQMESIKTFGKEKVQAKIFQEIFKLRYAKATCLFKATFVVTCIVNYFVELSSKGYLNFLHHLDIKKIKWWIILTFFFRMLRNTCCYYKKIAEKVLAV